GTDGPGCLAVAAAGLLADPTPGRVDGEVARGVVQDRAVLQQRAVRHPGHVVEDPVWRVVVRSQDRPVRGAHRTVGEGDLREDVVRGGRSDLGATTDGAAGGIGEVDRGS